MGRVTFQAETLDTGPWLQAGACREFARRRLTLRVDHFPADGLRIVHLTDLHVVNHWQPAYDRLHRQLAADPPDLVLITGDFVDDRFDSRDALPILGRLLGGLVARSGIFGIAGNHDTDLLLPHLAGMGVTLLHNEVRRVAGVELIGLAGVKRHETRRAWLEAVTGAADGTPRILMTHYPDSTLAYGTLGSILCLAGHTHGGQICLPGGRPLITHDKLGRPFHADAHRLQDPSGEGVLLVGRGLGTSTWPIRLFCPPEVWEVVLHRTTAA